MAMEVINLKQIDKKELYKDLMEISDNTVGAVCSESEFMKNADYFVSLLSDDQKNAIMSYINIKNSAKNGYRNSLRNLNRVLVECC